MHQSVLVKFAVCEWLVVHVKFLVPEQLLVYVIVYLVGRVHDELVIYPFFQLVQIFVSPCSCLGLRYLSLRGVNLAVIHRRLVHSHLGQRLNGLAWLAGDCWF